MLIQRILKQFSIVNHLLVYEVRSFLGLASYYRRFVQNFSIIASPLTKLLRKNVKFVWKEECQDSFDELKACLTSASVLTLPVTRLEYVVYSICFSTIEAT